MNLKAASLLAFLGTLVITIMMVFGFVNTLIMTISGLVPALTVLSMLVQAVAGACVTIFFYVFHKTQS